MLENKKKNKKYITFFFLLDFSLITGSTLEDNILKIYARCCWFHVNTAYTYTLDLLRNTVNVTIT